jgi:hypothetical protein
MGEIVDHAAEYATVERLAEMLKTAREDYKATEAYALFGAIVCWVMQRARTSDDQNALGDQNARSVRDFLDAADLADSSWGFKTARNVSVFQFFKEIRDSFAHGDARRVRPINQDRILRGYSFDLRERQNGPVLETVNLFRADMTRLGVSLAEVYCQVMKQELGDAYLEREAHAISEEIAA